MKILKYLFICSLVSVLAISCQKGIDPITPVSPGSDDEKPELVISYPIDGKTIKTETEIATITFKLVAQDDIELKSVELFLDGTLISSFTSFKDYRRASIAYDYTNLVDGTHIFSAIVTDLTGKNVTSEVNFKKVTVPAYTPLDGEIFFAPFEDEYLDYVTGNTLNIVGTPGFAEGKIGQAYAGATDAYLNFATTDLVKTNEISLAFWMKINATPDRAGIITVSPEDKTNAGYPAIQNKRTSGFRFFREASGGMQRLKGNVGLGGTNESWNDGGLADPTTNEWVHVAFVVSSTTSTIYINGEVTLESVLLNPIDWTGCDVLTIMSGAPRFTEWSHFSDLSLMDELHIFNRAITAAEVQSFYTAK